MKDFLLAAEALISAATPKSARQTTAHGTAGQKVSVSVRVCVH